MDWLLLSYRGYGSLSLALQCLRSYLSLSILLFCATLIEFSLLNLSLA